MRDVFAEWRVPAIRSSSPAGAALTYIAAANPGSGAILAVGTKEVSDGSSHRGVAGSYDAFWTRSAITGVPQNWHAIAAGDLVQARITLSGTTWTLSFADLTRRWHGSVSFKLPGYGYSTASWLQEDPPLGGADPPAVATADVRYPRLSDVSFSEVRLNGHHAPLQWSDVKALGVPGGPVLLPSRPSGTGFSVGPAEGAAAQYLADAAPYDFQFTRFAYAYSSWTGSTAISQRAAAAAPYATAAQAFARSLGSQHWPKNAQPDVQGLVGVIQQVAGLLQELRGLAPQNLASWNQSLVKTLELASQAGNQVRGDLGLPTA